VTTPKGEAMPVLFQIHRCPLDSEKEKQVATLLRAINQMALREGESEYWISLIDSGVSRHLREKTESSMVVNIVTANDALGLRLRQNLWERTKQLGLTDVGVF